MFNKDFAAFVLAAKVLFFLFEYIGYMWESMSVVYIFSL